jgi:hypothetical protein
MVIHLVVYSNGEPYDTTKRHIMKSIHQCTKKKVIIHDYNLKKIKKKPWFEYIKDLPSIDKPGRRDGYYNSWKAFIIKEVYDSMKEDDILYYVDSSRHFKEGFTENIDKLCNITNDIKCVAGSIGNDLKNKDEDCCNNVMVWNKIIPKSNKKYLEYPHVLNTWFLFKKCKSNDDFINDWAYYSCYTDKHTDPLVTYHHTGDQSIFSILVVKYNLPVFYHKDIKCNYNKNKNLVLSILNRSMKNDYFVTLSS